MVEAVVAVGLATLAFTGLVTAYGLYMNASFQSMRKIEAELIAEEGIEIARYLRDSGYAATLGTYSTVNPYWLSLSGSTWSATQTQQSFIAGRYDRRVTFSPVYRNASDDITTSGTVDPDTRKVTVTVSWRERNATTSVALSSYLTDIFNE